MTRHGVIVSQFLTTQPNDFHHFAPALENVLGALDRPERWVGDGHYGTYANLRIAHREGVVLYAPPAMQTGTQPPAPEATDSETQPQPDMAGADLDADGANDGAVVPRFGRHDFRHDAERDVLTCPAGQELRFIGEYPTDRGWDSYRLYGRRDCVGCALQQVCTTGRGRRVRLKVARPSGIADDAAPPEPPAPEGDGIDIRSLVHELQTRMDEAGDEMLKLRGQTVEPANAHLKQHGLGRFHVRGLSRCSSALTLACIAHNLMKWNARETAHAMKLSA